MFWNVKVKELEEEKKDLKRVISGLESEKKILKEEVSYLKLRKKMEEEDIKHMVKIDRERKDIELEGEKATEVANVKDTCRNKTEAQLEKQLVGMRDMYKEILERFPNYNIKHTISEK